MFKPTTDGLRDTLATSPTFDVEVPLHPTTHSCEDVATLVEGVLENIDRQRRQGRPMAHADVIQALSIAAAVQTARHDAAQHLARGLGISFHGLTIDARAAQGVRL
jgi:hypothetical protein